MITPRRIKLLSAAVLASVAFLLPAVANAACAKTSFSAEGYAVIAEGEAKAMYNAIIGWKMAVRKALGSDYTD